jgi:RHS repeat-associated protein
VSIAAASAYTLATIAAQVADGTTAADVVSSTSSVYGGVVFRVVDATSHLLLRFAGSATSGQVALFRRVGADYLLIQSTSVSPVATGSVHRIEARYTGTSVQAVWDGTVLFTATVTDYQTGAGAGLLWHADSQTTQFDNFRVTSSSAPTISSLSPTNGVIGTSVTIAGTNFGATQGTSTVTFNGTTATPTAWSTSSITVPVPSGATTGNVVVTVGGVPSDGRLFTLPAGPLISGVNPTWGPIATVVTIAGSSFGATQGTSTVKFNGTTATPTAWSATSITAPVPSGAMTGNVVVTVNSSPSNGVLFTVGNTPPTTPTISSITPLSGPVRTVLTINGSQFGASPGCATLEGNGVQVLAWSASAIVVAVPEGMLGPQTVRVSPDCSTSSNGVVFVAEGPILPSDAGGTPEYYHVDALGSVRLITSPAGAEVKRYDYLPFGQEWSPIGVDPNSVRFTGKERDRETEAPGWSALDYFGARYYQGQSGRFTAADPVVDTATALINPQLWNRYAYAANNPLRFTDPDGREVRPLGALALADIRSTVSPALRPSIRIGSNGLIDKGTLNSVRTSDENFLDLRRLANARGVLSIATAAGVNIPGAGYTEFEFQSAESVRADLKRFGIDDPTARAEGFFGQTTRTGSSTVRVTLSNGRGKTATMDRGVRATVAAHEMYGHALPLMQGLPWEHEVTYPRGSVNERIGEIERRTEGLYVPTK